MNPSTNITPDTTRKLTVVYFALAAGVMLFALVLGFLYWDGQASILPSTVELPLIRLLTMIHVVLWAAAVLLEPHTTRRILRDAKRPLDHTTFQRVVIARAYVMEMPAMFGLVICLLAITNGLMYAQPVWALNALSSLWMLGFVIQNRPDTPDLPERLENL